MSKHRTIVQQIHRRQRLRHIAANKLTAALTVLRHLQEGKPVSPKLLERAIRDLEALMERVDRKERERGR
jgi:N-acetylglucosamine kinase-like BadF-type ATPase